MDLKTVPQASVSRGEVIIQRPSVARRDTQRESKLNPRQFEERWQTGPFADVADKRLGGIGPRLWTQEHDNLVRRMRMEGARTSMELAQSRRDLTLTNERHNDTWRKLHKARDDVQMLREQLHQMESELREAQISLAEMDTIFAMTKQRRESRRYEDISGKQPADTERVATPDLFPDRAA